MTTSGVTTSEMDRDAVIAAAMRKLAALAKGQTPDAEDLTNGSEALNNLVAEFMTLGMPLWAKVTHTVPMVAGTSDYNIGVGQTVNTAFPLRIVQAYVSLDANGKIPLRETSAYDFNILPNGSSGTPTQYNYQPKINYGVFKTWPTPDATSAAGSLTVWYFAPFETFEASGDTPYFPREWNNALIYNLALLLAPEWGVPLNDRGYLEKQADKHLSIALDAGSEQASLFVSPDRGF